MLWWIPIAVAGMAALAVLTVVASTAAGRYEGQHVLTDPHEEWDAHVAEYGSMILGDELEWRNSSPQTIELDGVPDWLPASVDPAPWLAQTRAELSPEALEDARENTRRFNERVQRAVDAGGGIVDLPPGLYAPLDPLPEVVLPDAGGWISGPCLDDPGPGDAAVEPPASSGPDQAPPPPPNTDPQAAAGPSPWLARQLAITFAWSDWQLEKARIFA